MRDRVLVLLTNYRRPANLSACIKAWREQSLPPASVVVMDNSPLRSSGQAMRDGDEGMKELYPQRGLLGTDDVWRVSTNCGPLCRLWPALALSPKFDYILFCDDDFLPGREGIQAALDAAQSVNDKFSTIGQEGRTFSCSEQQVSTEMGLGKTVWKQEVTRTTWKYKYGSTPRLTDRPQVVDCTVRCHLVLAEYLHRVLRFRERVPASLCEAHDDLLLCLGLQVDPGFPSYILPTSTLARQLIVENLPGVNGPEACWKRPNHLTDRSLFVNLAHDAGWRSFAEGER